MEVDIFGRFKEVFFHKEWNQLIDTCLNPTDSLEFKGIVSILKVNYKEHDYRAWINKGNLEQRKYRYIHKKALEFFFSAKVLEILRNDVLLDAAAGRSGYLKAVRANTGCTSLYLNDHIYEGAKTDDGINVVGGDIASIKMNDESVTKIACHHAFEHFKNDKDTLFIKEIARLLSPGGCACIVPLFIVNEYTECWNIDRNAVFDKKARLLIDKSSSLPGGDEDGHFSRLYSVSAFKERVIDVAENSNLSCTVLECSVNDEVMPDMRDNFGSVLNKPLRLLRLIKV